MNEKKIEYNNEIYINEAVNEAEKALLKGEVPVGAVIVKSGIIIGRGHNLKETNNNAICHAELEAIKNASEYMHNWRLSGCDMYVTLEPCPMCSGAIAESRINNLYIGTFDPVMGACGSVMNIIQNDCFNHYVNIKWLYNETCSKLLENFFENVRRERKLVRKG